MGQSVGLRLACDTGWHPPDPLPRDGATPAQGQPAHLWSGLGLPFLRMLLAVVSLKCSRPTVTFVTCSGGRLTLRGQGRGRTLRGQALGATGGTQVWEADIVGACLAPLSSQAGPRVSPPRAHPRGRALT